MTEPNRESIRAAQKAIKARQVDQAVRLLRQAARQELADHRPWLMLAGLADSKDAALAYLDRAAELNSSDPTIEVARNWIAEKYGERVPPAVETSILAALSGRDVVWTAVGSLLLVVLVLITPQLMWLSPVRWVLGFAYVLFAPGYWLVNALFPNRGDIDGIERTGLSLGLSVAWVSILALILDWLPWGLHLWPVLVGDLVSIIIFMSVTVLRRIRIPEEIVYLPGPIRPRSWWRTQPTDDRRIYMILAGVLILALLSVAWVFLVPSPADFMTEFYILGPEGLAENYPRQAVTGETLTVTIGLTNLERKSHNYHIEVWAVDPWEEGRRQKTGEIAPFSLAVGQTFEYPLGWTMPWAGYDQKVEFVLYMDGNPEPYRQLLLWLDVLPPVE